ncbi:Mg2+ transporter protein [Neoconidiobolus thromboides FSU 785]|nr:Mg2+ transporter protein [Neoconidiobolus thromboides FSU 785]
MPGILVREKAILVNMLHIKAIVKADSVVVFDSFGSVNSLNQSLFIYDLQERLRSKSSYSMATPLEFRALEAILVSVASSLNQEMETTVQTVTSLLIQLEDDINRELLKRLLDVSKKLAHFDQKVLTIRRAIIEVLDQDEDLAAMYLTSKLKGEPRSIHQHEEIEMLLETYCKQIEEIANIISQLSNNVKSTEDIVNIILDSQRNSLLLLELRVAILTLGLTFSSLIAALFGMNLKNYFELDDFMFYIVTLSAFLTSAIITKTFLRRMNLLLKLHK